MSLDEFLARYNNDYDEITFKKKGEEESIYYWDLVKNYELSKIYVYEFGIDPLGDLYITFKE